MDLTQQLFDLRALRATLTPFQVDKFGVALDVQIAGLVRVVVEEAALDRAAAAGWLEVVRDKSEERYAWCPPGSICATETREHVVSLFT